MHIITLHCKINLVSTKLVNRPANHASPSNHLLPPSWHEHLKFWKHNKEESASIYREKKKNMNAACTKEIDPFATQT